MLESDKKMCFFTAPDEKKMFWGEGNFFFVKSVHKGLIYLRRNFGGDRIKIEAARKQKPPKKHIFFQVLNRKNRPKKPGNIFLSKKNLIKNHVFLGGFGFLESNLAGVKFFLNTFYTSRLLRPPIFR